MIENNFDFKNENCQLKKGTLTFKPHIVDAELDLGAYVAIKNKIKTIIVHEGVQSLGISAFLCCHNLTKIQLPNSLELIQEFALGSNYSLRDIVIPDSVTEIRRGAFCESGLRKVTLSKNIKHIAPDLFKKCMYLENIEIPQGVNCIGTNAFYGCSRLKNVTIPEGVEFFGSNVFEECRSLEKIIIPKSVTVIGGFTFNECENLNSVIINGNIETLPIGTFHNNSSLTLLQLPSTIKFIDDNAFDKNFDFSKLKVVCKNNEYVKEWARLKGCRNGNSKLNEFLEINCDCERSVNNDSK